MEIIRRRSAEREEKFWANVEVTGFCWLWLGGKTKDGYGYMGWQKTTWTAHKIAHTLLVGEVPQGLQIDHLCNIRNCVNPCHLEVVTKKENLRRMVERKGWTPGGKKYVPLPEHLRAPPKPSILEKGVCKRGHLVTEYSIRWFARPNGTTGMLCLACTAENKQKYKEREARFSNG